MSTAEEVSRRLGTGLIAGAAGTAAMTVSSTAEMKMRSRPPSPAPRKVAERLLRVRAKDRGGKRLATVSHAALGVGLAAACRVAGIRGPAGFFAASMTPEVILVPALGAADPPWRWGLAESAISAWHHAVYAFAAAAACRGLER
ncbi:MAG TPA: hypothetical protein VKA89_04855 [Solirubrobacterales bacterium]|nr:hypothetical protein [Solirubrobacterales bacterium]